MAVNLGALVRLGACTKGSPYVPEAVPLGLNGVFPYPNFSTVAGAANPNEISGQVLKNGPSGVAVTATFSVASLSGATIVPAQMTQATTDALDCERLYWSCWANSASGIRTPLCYGWIAVRAK